MLSLLYAWPWCVVADRAKDESSNFVPRLRGPASLPLRVFVEKTQSQRCAVSSGDHLA